MYLIELPASYFPANSDKTNQSGFEEPIGAADSFSSLSSNSAFVVWPDCSVKLVTGNIISALSENPDS